RGELVFALWEPPLTDLHGEKAYWRKGYLPGLREHRLAPSGWSSCQLFGSKNPRPARGDPDGCRQLE
ncbi:hypothetical protein ACFV0W_14460, partial [Streptomyces anulatus]